MLTGRQPISLTCLSTTGFGSCGIPPSRWNHWRRSSTGSSTGRCRTLLCVEGSIATGPDGTILFNTFDGKPKRDLVYELCSVADYVLALGTCASYGGIPAAPPNPTAAVGLQYADGKPGGLLGKDWRSDMQDAEADAPPVPRKARE